MSVRDLANRLADKLTDMATDEAMDNFYYAATAPGGHACDACNDEMGCGALCVSCDIGGRAAYFCLPCAQNALTQEGRLS